MKKAALLLCTLLLAALAGCQLGGKAIILPKAGNITAIQVETLEGEASPSPRRRTSPGCWRC